MTYMNINHYYRCIVSYLRKTLTDGEKQFFEVPPPHWSDTLTSCDFVINYTEAVGLMGKCKIDWIQAVVTWLSYCRDVCEAHLMNAPIMLEA